MMIVTALIVLAVLILLRPIVFGLIFVGLLREAARGNRRVGFGTPTAAGGSADRPMRLTKTAGASARSACATAGNERVHFSEAE